MTKYLFSRFLIIFFLKFFSGWVLGIDKQFIQFFHTNLTDNFFLKILSWVIILVIIAFGLFVINISFTFIRLTYKYTCTQFIQKGRDQGLMKSANKFIKNFHRLFIANINNEIAKERYPYGFLCFGLVFLPFMHGNPIFNNYYGIYKSIEVDESLRDIENTKFVTNIDFIIDKKNKNEIASKIDKLEAEYRDGDPYYEVEKRGYLFIQAGIIDGFKTKYKEYKGLQGYLVCLFYFAVEKLIIVTLYFLLPFIIFISIFHFLDRRTDWFTTYYN
jgi:hypothetical protein